MSFSICNLSVLAYSNGFTLWLYKASLDSRSTIVDADFFEEAGDMLSQGDMIVVSSSSGGFLLCVRVDDLGKRALPLS